LCELSRISAHPVSEWLDLSALEIRLERGARVDLAQVPEPRGEDRAPRRR